MGAGLALAAFGVSATVTPAARNVFVLMALTAHDADPRPHYWGGRDRLCKAVGAEPGEAGHLAVRRALTALRKASLIRDLSLAHRGHQADYSLMDGDGHPLRPAPTTVGKKCLPNTDEGDQFQAERETNSVRKVGEKCPPKEEEDYKEEGAPPPRSCRKHESWEHDQPCRACMADRKAADAWKTAEALRPRPARKHKHRAMEDGTCLGCDLLLNSSDAWVERNDPSLALDSA